MTGPRAGFATDRVIDQLAGDQRGLVTRTQLLANGVTRHAIEGRVQARRLRVVHRGVYRVGPVDAPYWRELAAVLACGPKAVLSHRSAARVWQLVSDSGASPVDITLPAGDRGRRPGIRVYRMCVRADEVTESGGIPLTKPSRTIVDLAPMLSSSELEAVLARAERESLLDHDELLALAAERAGRPGAPLMRALLEKDVVPAFTRSEAELRMLALLRKAHLPAPETNVRVGAWEVDFFWRRERLVVEVDGFAYHATTRQFENDRRRDGELSASGIRVMRVTWRQLTSEPEALLVRLAQTLVRQTEEW